jgi:glycosyltransferase involved in cell wall biosynthesis
MKPLLDGYPEQPLVSIIIPCYNAERWLSHAILSCLEQTYRPIEIIVIDDGSTDGSLDIIKSYDKALTWETGPNRGGNAARNRGFALSKGEYIQFLDADDYLLPEKIEHDMQCIAEMDVDIVYSDFYIEQYTPDLTTRTRSLIQTGAREDMLQAILSGWGVAVHTLFFRRAALAHSAGWDENIRAVQERDLLITLLLNGATIAYYPGAACVHRRYGPVTVSTSDPVKVLTNHCTIFQKTELKLRLAGSFSPKYRYALARGYFQLARGFYDTDRTRYTALLCKALSLDAALKPDNQSRMYTLLYQLFGFAGADTIASTRRQIIRRFDTVCQRCAYIVSSV